MREVQQKPPTVVIGVYPEFAPTVVGS